MTLIIAGYEHSKTPDHSRFIKDAPPHTPEMKFSGIFAIADSAITAHKGGKTLLNGFGKIHEVEAKLWKPYFLPDGSFKDYFEVYESRRLLIGFAGSTLTAQHIINGITEHLGNLRISFSRKNDIGPISYKVIRHCQKNPLASSAETSYWDDDTFLNSDFEGLLTGEVIADIVEHSINNALRSASKYKLDMDDFISMHTELICGTWCPHKKRHELYVFRMLSDRDEDGVLFAKTKKELVKENEVAVLGMRSDFETDAQTKFNDAISKFNEPTEVMREYLEDCIDTVQSSGSKEIDHPVILRRIEQHKISKEVYFKQ